MTNDENDTRISDDLAAKMVNDLSSDELEKVSLIVCSDVDQMIRLNDRQNADNYNNDIMMDFEWESLTFGHKREIWIEILFLIKRYDLLRLLFSCKIAAQSQIQEKTYFPLNRRLLLRVYEGMTEKREKEFRSQIEALKPNATSRVDDIKTATLGSLLCRFGNSDIHLNDLNTIFKKMDWEDMSEQLEWYKLQNVDNEYVIDRSQQPIGLCLIVNNMTSTRPGSEIDINLLKDVFEGFGFKVIVKLDVGPSELFAELKEVAEMDHREKSVFVCCLMGHGTNDGFYCQDENIVSIKHEIIREFHSDKCPTLKEKPKLFFVQACRPSFPSNNGLWPIVGRPSRTDTDAVSHLERRQSGGHKEADILQSYATVEGDDASRFSDGSPYIKALANNLRHFGKTLNILDILTNVNKDVPQDVLPKDLCQQPTFETTLTKILKLG